MSGELTTHTEIWRTATIETFSIVRAASRSAKEAVVKERLTTAIGIERQLVRPAYKLGAMKVPAAPANAKPMSTDA